MEEFDQSARQPIPYRFFETDSGANDGLNYRDHKTEMFTNALSSACQYALILIQSNHTLRLHFYASIKQAMALIMPLFLMTIDEHFASNLSFHLLLLS